MFDNNSTCGLLNTSNNLIIRSNISALSSSSEYVNSLCLKYCSNVLQNGANNLIYNIHQQAKSIIEIENISNLSGDEQIIGDLEYSASAQLIYLEPIYIWIRSYEQNTTQSAYDTITNCDILLLICYVVCIVLVRVACWSQYIEKVEGELILSERMAQLIPESIVADVEQRKPI